MLNFSLYRLAVTEFNTIALHGSFNDHWFWLGARAQMAGSMGLRYATRKWRILGHGVLLNLFINGLYWGI